MHLGRVGLSAKSVHHRVRWLIALLLSVFAQVTPWKTQGGGRGILRGLHYEDVFRGSGLQLYLCRHDSFTGSHPSLYLVHFSDFRVHFSHRQANCRYR